MQSKNITFRILFGVLMVLTHQNIGLADMTPLQSESTGSLVQTDWGPGSLGISTPTFQQFDPTLGTLTAVDLTLTINTGNTYYFDFTNTSSTQPTTLTETNGGPAGPTGTVYGPNDTTELFNATTQIDSQEKTGTSSTGTYTTTTSYSAGGADTLTSASSLFSSFIGTGTIELPVNAVAYSTFSSSSGNGSGKVTTVEDATVTVQYSYTPAVVPEPSSWLSLGIGIGVTLLTTRGLGCSGRQSSY